MTDKKCTKNNKAINYINNFKEFIGALIYQNPKHISEFELQKNNQILCYKSDKTRINIPLNVFPYSIEDFSFSARCLENENPIYNENDKLYLQHVLEPFMYDNLPNLDSSNSKEENVKNFYNFINEIFMFIKEQYEDLRSCRPGYTPNFSKIQDNFIKKIIKEKKESNYNTQKQISISAYNDANTENKPMSLSDIKIDDSMDSLKAYDTSNDENDYELSAYNNSYAKRYSTYTPRYSTYNTTSTRESNNYYPSRNERVRCNPSCNIS